MLDVSVRAGILNLMREVRETHRPDGALHLPRPGAGALRLRRTLVMYLGVIVEDGPTEESSPPQHPYTQALVAAVPRRRAI